VLTDEHKAALGVLADVYIEQRQEEKAIILLEALRVVFPEDVAVLKALSFAMLRAGRYGDSLEAVEAFLRLRPAVGESAPILLIRSRALLGLGRGNEARDSHQEYLGVTRST